jgi:hypothetical protein
VLASPLFPIGRARLAEFDRGVRADWPVLGLGFLLVVALLVAVACATGWRMTLPRRVAREWRPSRWAERIGRAGGAVSAVTGVRFAIQRDRAPASTSLVATVFGLIAAVAAIGAALLFATNLDRLVTTPAQYGWNWDALMDTYDSGASSELRARVTSDHDLTGVTIGSRATLLLEGRAVPAFGLARVRGSALPRVSEGRLPAGHHEIVLGVQTLRDLGRSVGERVTASTPNGPVTLRVVGSTTLPSLSLNGSFGLGEGAAVTAGALRSLDPAAQPSFFLVNLRPGVARRTVNGRYADTASTLGAQRPADIQSYDHVRGTPMLLAGLLAVLGAGVLAHLLVTSIRARRHDLAILKTLGLARRQVRATVAWQATTLVAIALAIGIPIAFVAGRWTWQGFAGRLGVDDYVRVPASSFVLIAVAGGLLANLIAAVPARTAARTRPAIVLRSE